MGQNDDINQLDLHVEAERVQGRISKLYYTMTTYCIHGKFKNNLEILSIHIKGDSTKARENFDICNKKKKRKINHLRQFG